MAEYKNYNYYTSDNFAKSEEPQIKEVELDEDVYVVSTTLPKPKLLNKRKVFAASKETTIVIICMLIALILATIISRYVVHHTTVDGVSMSYTFKDGDVIIIDKITYRFSKPRRFDVVIFPINDDEYYIKRIIGLPGETIQIIDGKIYINEQLLDDPYGYEDITYYGLANTPLVIGEGQYFMLGDNRNKSVDSRDSNVGLIDEEKIIGRAIYILYPFDRLGKINHETNKTIRQENEN